MQKIQKKIIPLDHSIFHESNLCKDEQRIRAKEKKSKCIKFRAQLTYVVI